MATQAPRLQLGRIAPGLISFQLGAIAAQTPQFEHRSFNLELGLGRNLAHGSADIGIVNMARIAAFVANEEDAVMGNAGMRARKKGIGAFNPQREPMRDEHIEDPVDRIGGHPPAASAR